MVSRSVRKFEAEKVRKSFHICGFDAMGKEVPRAELHSRLLEVMDVEEDGPLPEDPDSGDESDDPECAEAPMKCLTTTINTIPIGMKRNRMRMMISESSIIIS